jgi:hypothetical protein
VVGRGSLPRTYRGFGKLAKHLRYIERTSRKLARQTFYGVGRWQAKLEYRQQFLARIVDIGAELYAMAAACSRAQLLKQDGNRDGQLLADLFCRQARVRVEALLESLWHNSDDADRAITGRVLAGDFGWLEAGIIDASEGTGPWIVEAVPRASTLPNQARRVR